MKSPYISARERKALAFDPSKVGGGKSPGQKE
jgi:hypothetical protein